MCKFVYVCEHVTVLIAYVVKNAVCPHNGGKRIQHL